VILQIRNRWSESDVECLYHYGLDFGYEMRSNQKSAMALRHMFAAYVCGLGGAANNLFAACRRRFLVNSSTTQISEPEQAQNQQCEVCK